MADQISATRTTYTDADLELFASTLRGTLLRPTDAGYAERRVVWNGMIDRHPALIVQCEGVADVIAAIAFARDHDLPLSTRGGGHNVAGSALCEGVVIDLQRMNSVRVDPVARRVRVGGGATLGMVDHETQAFGLAVPFGVVSKTGVAGLTLHGGMGFLTSPYGLSCDNLVSADVVTANGELLVVDENQNSDLLWALRGGGGNFGVVTSFEFALHPVGPTVWMGIVMYPLDLASRVIDLLRDYQKNGPEEISLVGVYMSVPHEGPIPEEVMGKPCITIAACFGGDFEKGEEAIAPLRALGEPYVDFSGPMPFTVAQRLFDPEFPDGDRYYWKSIYMNELDDKTAAAIASAAATRPSQRSTIDIWVLKGAYSRVAPDATAFGRRDAPFLLGVEANWSSPDDDDANIAWTRDLISTMGSLGHGGMYLNFPGFQGEQSSIARNIYGANYERLKELKKKYDPENVFKGTIPIGE